MTEDFQKYVQDICDSSPCNKKCMQLVLNIIAWPYYLIDIKSLWNKNINWDAYVKPPKEAECNDNVLWKLILQCTDQIASECEEIELVGLHAIVSQSYPSAFV